MIVVQPFDTTHCVVTSIQLGCIHSYPRIPEAQDWIRLTSYAGEISVTLSAKVPSLLTMARPGILQGCVCLIQSVSSLGASWSRHRMGLAGFTHCCGTPPKSILSSTTGKKMLSHKSTPNTPYINSLSSKSFPWWHVTSLCPTL